MFLSEYFKELSHLSAPNSFSLFEPAADAPYALKQLSVAEKLLIRYGTLDYDLGLAVYRQNGGLAGSLQLPNMIFRVSLEVAERVDVSKVDDHT